MRNPTSRGRGQQRSFRQGSDFALERELFAAALREKAGEAVLPVRGHLLTDGASTTVGILKPFIEGTTPLDYQVERLTTEERTAALADMPWAFVLGNWDTKPDQYVRAGGAAVNIDWDRALSDYAAPNPTYDRHTRAHFSQLVPPIQGVLLLEHVCGRVDLDLSSLQDSAARIAALSEKDVRDALAPVFEAAYGPDGAGFPGLPDAESVVRAVLERKGRVVEATNALIADVQEQRARTQKQMSWLDVRLLGQGLADLHTEAGKTLAESPLLDFLYKVRQRMSSG